MRVLLYARVSSEKQAEKDLSISAQLKELRKYANKKGWEVYREFIDEAQSARSANRPAFQEMIALAKKESELFDAILVWKFSRFSRNRTDSLIYKNMLKKHGISVHSINEPIDESPTGHLVEGMIELVDELYSLNLAQDTVRGMKENAERGFCNGGTTPIGYVKIKVLDGSNERSKLDIDPNFAPIIQRIFQMSLDGIGGKEIVKTLNAEGLRTNTGKLWSKSLVYYILKNEKYTGTGICKWKSGKSKEVTRIVNNHSAIIDLETFNKVQQALKNRSPQVRHPRRVYSEYLLSGLIYCKKCEAKMIGHSAKSGKFFYYSCTTHSKKGKLACDAKSINKNALESFLIEKISEIILTEEHLTELAKITNEELAKGQEGSKQELAILEKQLGEAKKKLDKLYDVLETGKLDLEDIAPRIKEHKLQVDDLQHRKLALTEILESTKPCTIDPDTIKICIINLRKILQQSDFNKKKTFFQTVIERVTIDLPEIVVNYRNPIGLVVNYEMPKKQKAEPSSKKVLPFDLASSPGEPLYEHIFHLPIITFQRSSRPHNILSHI